MNLGAKRRSEAKISGFTQCDATPMDGLTETKISGEQVFDGKLLHIRRDTVRLPDQKTATREFVVHPGAVMIIPVFEDGMLLVERQFRYPIGQIMTEFPAGKLDPREEPLQAAKRELQEETGFSASEWLHFHTHHPLIAYSTERIEFFIARGLTAGTTRLDDGEFIKTERKTVDDLLRGIKTGEITDGKTTAGLLLALQLGYI
jgi:ADP-ribose pyrophosphatase